MAKKTLDPYDFSEFRHLSDTDAFVEKRYPTDLDVIAAAEAYVKNAGPDAYLSSYTTRAITEARAVGNLSMVSNRWIRRNIREWAFDSDPANKASREAAIMAWFQSNEKAIEVYRYASPHVYWWEADVTDGVNNHISSAEATTRGYTANPRSSKDIERVLNTREATTYVELNRKQVYMEGDLVMLRKAYVGNYRYDPHWNTQGMNPSDPRLGTVMGADASETQNYRGTKGSRLIKVLWFGKDGNWVNVPEKHIKLESRKGRKAAMKEYLGEE